MTKKQVYAAKDMYTRHIRCDAIRLNCAIEENENVTSIVTKIMKKTSSEFMIKKVLNFYAHYVQMQQRIDFKVWEEEE